MGKQGKADRRLGSRGGRCGVWGRWGVLEVLRCSSLLEILRESWVGGRYKLVVEKKLVGSKYHHHHYRGWEALTVA